ncbi:hypothetical protein AUR64_19405 [Haloprofundus marisrubri]|uniref:DUF1616 domain-containing protein n=1 Tax=Haloprofundus marisrubri TaxID=1514971 RepID=A0A0W1R689_9EURY|nr:DUF1616 domain-containing protein [Haloprofundus marisrubri]KTG08400.1 hypothetical protein AUR64_19405 [Haloprofundus marisrubri]
MSHSPYSRRSPWFTDLVAAFVLLGVAAGAIHTSLSGLPRLLLTLPLVLFLPGYALVSAIFPDRNTNSQTAFDDAVSGLRNPLPTARSVTGVERVALAVVGSALLVPLVTLGVHFSPQPIALLPVAIGVEGTTGVLLLVALVRRATLDADERYAPPYPTAITGLFSSRPPEHPLRGRAEGGRLPAVALALSLLVLLSTVGYAATVPADDEQFTEFYVETEDVDGNTQSMYQNQFTAGSSANLTFGVENREQQSQSYTVVVVSERVQTNGNETTVTESEQIGSADLTLDSKENTTRDVTVTPSMPGDVRFTLLLYRDGAPAEPSVENAYRSLRLYVTVSGGGQNGSLASPSETDSTLVGDPPTASAARSTLAH